MFKNNVNVNAHQSDLIFEFLTQDWLGRYSAQLRCSACVTVHLIRNDQNSSSFGQRS